MIEEKLYKKIVSKMMKLRYDEKLKKNDFIVMSYLFCILDTDKPKDIKQKRIVEFTDLAKSEVSKAVRRLLESEILITINNEFEFGLKINDCFESEE